MRSIAIGSDIEARHFMDDDHQITIGIKRNLWPVLQDIANRTASERRWLSGKGSDWDYLNIWVIGRLSSCPEGIEPHDWLSRAAG